ncbi:hypothetical protein [Gemmobacter denitrificans]|uniref:Uncharacterized protein n=1 Tax=Gemmobacter denitrificans TaxID=3123040 RepID=A0ABU8BVH5_9RHOB
MAYVDVLKGPGERLLLFRTFNGGHVQDFHAEGDHFWCLGRFRKGQDEGSQIVRHDLTSGQEQASVWIGGGWRPMQRFAISETTVLVGYDEVAVLDPQSLARELGDGDWDRAWPAFP